MCLVDKIKTAIYMAEHWLVQYLPCDRVFGVVEKNLRRTERIYNREEHYPFFQENGKLFDVSKIWPVLLLQCKIGSLLQKTTAYTVSMGVPANPAKKFDIRKLLQEHAARGGRQAQDFPLCVQSFQGLSTTPQRPAQATTLTEDSSKPPANFQGYGEGLDYEILKGKRFLWEDGRAGSRDDLDINTTEASRDHQRRDQKASDEPCTVDASVSTPLRHCPRWGKKKSFYQ
ncbi:hypothetical protein RRG08_007672 [Elysia crispata]|uniref:Uncharacterized protein n=1 Tax=Elysia crispata TaxID=231223 RepID=A0AAE0Y399_9GAST|nr:hypothetical protein RRG08_007672 [Elysia crispata]